MMEWSQLPELLLRNIFRHLNVKEVLVCSTVCTRWYAISQDSLIWKRLLFTKYFYGEYETLSLPFVRDLPDVLPKLRDGSDHWKNEYIRLVGQSPSRLIHTLQGHKEKVLHITFSHNGSEISSCSTDNQVIRWKRYDQSHFESHWKVNMDIYGWDYIDMTQYNPSDTKLLVLGHNRNSNIDIIVFSTTTGGSVRLVCTISWISWKILVDWHTDDYVIVGEVERPSQSDQGYCLSLESSSCWLCKVADQNNSEANECESTPSRKRRLFQLCDTYLSNILLVKQAFQESLRLDSDCSKCTDSGRFRRHERKINKSSDLTNRETAISDEKSMGAPNVTPIPSEAENRILEKNSSGTPFNNWIIFTFGHIDFISHQIGFHYIKNDLMSGLPVASTTTEILDQTLEMNGLISGIALSYDEHLLYVNVKPLNNKGMTKLRQKKLKIDVSEDFCQYPEIRTIDLNTLEICQKYLQYHTQVIDFQRNTYLRFFSLQIFNGVILVGFHDSKVYLWDKYYGILVSSLSNNSKCDSSTIYEHGNSGFECAIACDSGEINIWSSQKLFAVKQSFKSS